MGTLTLDHGQMIIGQAATTIARLHFLNIAGATVTAIHDAVTITIHIGHTAAADAVEALVGIGRALVREGSPLTGHRCQSSSAKYHGYRVSVIIRSRAWIAWDIYGLETIACTAPVRPMRCPCAGMITE
jgi:hypothetical protein